MARNEIAKVETTSNGVIFDFDKYGKLDASLNGLSSEIITRLAVHGLRQKVGDTYAGVASYAAKEGGDPQELAAQWAGDTYATLQKGEWSEKREGSGEGSLSLLAEAIARFKADGEDAKTKQAKLAAMTKEQRQALRTHPPIASLIADINAERKRAAAASATADAPAVLANI